MRHQSLHCLHMVLTFCCPILNPKCFIFIVIMLLPEILIIISQKPTRSKIYLLQNLSLFLGRLHDKITHKWEKNGHDQITLSLEIVSLYDFMNVIVIDMNVSSSYHWRTQWCSWYSGLHYHHRMYLTMIIIIMKRQWSVNPQHNDHQDHPHHDHHHAQAIDHDAWAKTKLGWGTQSCHCRLSGGGHFDIFTIILIVDCDHVGERIIIINISVYTVYSKMAWG